MKILIINTYYYHRGGDTTYAFSLASLLRSRGHTVRFFGMHHPANLPTDDARYFVDYIDFVEEMRDASVGGAVRVLSRSIYSVHARKKIRAMLNDFRPDVVHIQNLHAHITPSILGVLKEEGIPIVWTLHDYKLLCPNNDFVSNGTVCEQCKGGKFFSCTIRRCKKGSLAASFIATLEAESHKLLRIPEIVDRFIAPSRFLRNKFIDFGWPENKVTFVRNFLTEDYFQKDGTGDEGFVLFVGRMERIKGVMTLVHAVDDGFSGPVVFAGDGTLRQMLADRQSMNPGGPLSVLGAVTRDEVKSLIRRCSYVVIPSEWYENCPYSVMEVQAIGKPVIGSNIGGIPELVLDGENGIVVPPGDHQALSDAMSRLSADRSLRHQFGAQAQHFAWNEYHPDAHYRSIIAVYQQVLSEQ